MRGSWVFPFSNRQHFFMVKTLVHDFFLNCSTFQSLRSPSQPTQKCRGTRGKKKKKIALRSAIVGSLLLNSEIQTQQLTHKEKHKPRILYFLHLSTLLLNVWSMDWPVSGERKTGLEKKIIEKMLQLFSLLRFFTDSCSLKCDPSI